MFTSSLQTRVLDQGRLSAGVLMAALVAAALMMPACAQSEPGVEPAPATQPAPALTVRDVVAAQLAGLKAPDSPTRDAGLAQVFAFASPGNRRQTGPLAKFSQIVRAGYPEMLSHRAASIEEVAQSGDAVGDNALAAVRIVAADGAVATYVFYLRKVRTDRCGECWMTDGVSQDDSRPDEIAT